MVLSFFQKDAGDDIPALIAKKNYSRAIDVIREKLKSQKDDLRLRMQLADVLVQAGKGQQAVTILLPIADEYASEGFAPKAIAVLKKIQRIDPTRSDIDARLASLIQEKQRVATVDLPATSDSGIIEIGFEPIGLGGSISVPVAAAEPPGPQPEPAGPEIGFEPEALAFTPATSHTTLAASSPAPVVDQDLFAGEPEEHGIELGLEVAPEEEPVGSTLHAPATRAPEPELRLEEEPLHFASDAEPAFGAAAEPELLIEPEPAPPAASTPPPAAAGVRAIGEPEAAEELPLLDLAPEPAASGGERTAPASSDPMSDSQFADELMSVLEEAFPSGLGAPLAPSAEAPSAAQIVVSPLFRDFSVDEMVEVIAGLKLLTFEAGDIIITQGERGDSLYMLTSGTVKASVRNAQGRQVPVAELEEGSFFGEMSMLSGEPRTATVVAAERCELLELDRPTLDGITRRYPRVLDVLREFAAQRALEQQRRRRG